MVTARDVSTNFGPFNLSGGQGGAGGTGGTGGGGGGGPSVCVVLAAGSAPALDGGLSFVSAAGGNGGAAPNGSMGASGLSAGVRVEP